MLYVCELKYCLIDLIIAYRIKVMGFNPFRVICLWIVSQNKSIVLNTHWCKGTQTISYMIIIAVL